MDTSKYTKLKLLSAQLSVEFFPAEQVGQIATDLSTTVDSRLATINTSIQNIHTHANKDVLDGITAEKVTAWDGAEAGAKSYANEKVAALTATYDAKGAAADALTAANSYTDTTVANLINGAPEAYDTLKEIADWIANDETGVSALTNRVAALETGKADLSAVNELASDLTNRVTALETAKANISEVTELGSEVSQMSTTVGNHIADTDIHVTAADKTTWNGKQDALTDAQLSAVNSGVDADWKTAVDNHFIGNDSAISNITQSLNTKASTSTVDALETEVGDIGRTLDAASQLTTLPTDGSISTRAIIDKVNELIGALAIQHT